MAVVYLFILTTGPFYSRSCNSPDGIPGFRAPDDTILTRINCTFLVNNVESGSAHGWRNELCMWLKRFRWPVQCSRLLWARGWKYLRLLTTREREKTLSSQIAVEVKLVAQPVGHISGHRVVRLVPRW